MSDLEVALSVDACPDDCAAGSHPPRRAGLQRRIAYRVVGGVLIGAWVAMPLMPLAAILLSWLNGLS